MSDETDEITLEGAGILGGSTWGPKARARHEAGRAAERKRDEEAAKSAAELQSLCDGIDATMAPHLRAELAAENKVSRITPEAKKDFTKFKASCQEWGLLALPAEPQAVAVHMAAESLHGYKHLRRIRNSISNVHLAASFPDPTTDILVRALLRQSRDEHKSKPQTTKDQD